MILYIDKNNIKSIVQGRNEKTDLYYEIVNFVKKGLDVHYNFSKDEIYLDKDVDFWFKSVKGSGVKTNSNYCPTEKKFPEHPIKENIINLLYHKENGLRSIYLVESDNETVDYLNDNKVVLFGNVGKEYDIFKLLSEVEEKKDAIHLFKIKSWLNYCPHLPVTDLVMCDEYYFDNRYDYEHNKNEILKAIAKNAKYQLNIVIITKNIDRFYDPEDLCKQIKKDVMSASEISDENNCSVTIILSSKFHDRHLITNYYRIYVGAGYIKESKKEDVLVSIGPNTSKVSYETTNDLIKQFNRAIEINRGVFGDRKSNILKFDI